MYAFMDASKKREVRFDALFEIGRGGVALVRAERMTHEDGTSRVVAVKRLLPLVAGDPKTRDMFLDEARLAAMIRHPNVVQIVDWGQDDEAYIAMELVRGEPLSSLVPIARQLGERPLEPPLAAYVVAQVCEALHAAHELRDGETGETLGLVHRDVSPQNILLGYDGVARLTDFGIAKALGFGSRTRTGEVKGKLAYMSPEQAMCDPLDRRSDLFAVGAVLFECLSGRRMLGEGGDVDLLRRLSTEDAPPLTEAWAEAPPSLCALHARLVARDPSARPRDAWQVAQALHAHALATATRPPQELLAARMARMFPRRAEQLEERISLTEREVRKALPYLADIEDYVDRPSRLYHERRRARNMLAVGLGMLGLAVAFVAAAALTRSRSSAPSGAAVQQTAREPAVGSRDGPPTTPAVASAPASASAAVIVAASHRSTAAGSLAASSRPSASASATRESKAGGSVEPPPAAPSSTAAPPVRGDKLDENPF
jgi:serine/threonine-protein kinase